MGRGGSRYGAGRPAYKVKAEQCRAVDARRWAREGILDGGRIGTWAWTDAETGELMASVGYESDSHAVTLTYSLSGQLMRQRVPTRRTTCNYGGTRAWFACPRCSRQVAVLFLRNLGFGCRKCNRIAYSSQSDDPMGRAWRRQTKIERRLGDDWERPKGMHRSTFDLLLEKLESCELAKDDAMLEVLARLAPDLYM
jgi:hypothetical protein